MTSAFVSSADAAGVSGSSSSSSFFDSQQPPFATSKPPPTPAPATVTPQFTRRWPKVNVVARVCGDSEDCRSRIDGAADGELSGVVAEPELVRRAISDRDGVVAAAGGRAPRPP